MFSFEPEKFEWAPFQHYRNGQKLLFYNITEESKRIIRQNEQFGTCNLTEFSEDIAFYNGKMPWLYITSVTRDCYILELTMTI